MRLRSLLLAGLALPGLLACLSLDVPSEAKLPAGGRHVLFIGNSLTYVNDLPAMVSRLAAITGDTVRVAMLAKPNYALVDHLADGSAQSRLRGERWDVVVLQQGSSALDDSRLLLYEGVDQLAPLIRAAGGTPALYEVWPMASRSFDVPRVRESYRSAAVRVNGLFYPAGTAWQEAWSRDPALVLYDGDGLHPSPLGSLLAALVMVEQLTAKDIRLLSASAIAGQAAFAVSTDAVRVLQEAAHAANARGTTP